VLAGYGGTRLYLRRKTGHTHRTGRSFPKERPYPCGDAATTALGLKGVRLKNPPAWRAGPF